MVEHSSQQPAGDDPTQHPGFLEVQRKMRKLMLWSGLVMVIGIAAIIGVIVYKSMGDKKSPSVATSVQSGPITQVLAAGEEVQSISAEGDYVFVLVKGKGIQSILQFEAANMSLVRRMQFIPQGN